MIIKKVPGCKKTDNIISNFNIKLTMCFCPYRWEYLPKMNSGFLDDTFVAVTGLDANETKIFTHFTQIEKF